MSFVLSKQVYFEVLGACSLCTASVLREVLERSGAGVKSPGLGSFHPYLSYNICFCIWNTNVCEFCIRAEIFKVYFACLPYLESVLLSWSPSIQPRFTIYDKRKTKQEKCAFTFWLNPFNYCYLYHLILGFDVISLDKICMVNIE